MTWRDAAGLVGLLWCAALLAWSNPAGAPSAEACRPAQVALQDDAVTDFLFAPASVWKQFALERDLDVAMLRSADAPGAGRRSR